MSTFPELITTVHFKDRNYNTYSFYTIQLYSFYDQASFPPSTSITYSVQQLDLEAALKGLYYLYSTVGQ